MLPPLGHVENSQRPSKSPLHAEDLTQLDDEDAAVSGEGAQAQGDSGSVEPHPRG
jgi:hypothetical protein